MIGDSIFGVEDKKEKLISDAVKLSSLIEHNNFLDKKVETICNEFIKDEKTALEISSYIFRTAGGVAGFAGGHKFSKKLLDKLGAKFMIPELAAKTAQRSSGQVSRRAAIVVEAAELPATTRLVTNKWFRGCGKFVGGMLVSFAAEELIGGIFSYFKGKQLQEKLEQLNETFNEQLKHLQKYTTKKVTKQNYEEIYREIYEGRQKIDVQVKITDEDSLDKFFS